MRKLLVVFLMSLVLLSGFTLSVSATDEPTFESTSSDTQIVIIDGTGGVITQSDPWVPIGD